MIDVLRMRFKSESLPIRSANYKNSLFSLYLFHYNEIYPL